MDTDGHRFCAEIRGTTARTAVDSDFDGWEAVTLSSLEIAPVRKQINPVYDEG